MTPADPWQEMDEWCVKQQARFSKLMSDHIMSGGNIEDPVYRWQFGNHHAFSRMRSFIHGSRARLAGHTEGDNHD